MGINLIRSFIEKLKFSSHAKEEMLYEEYGAIHEQEVKEAIDIHPIQNFGLIIKGGENEMRSLRWRIERKKGY